MRRATISRLELASGRRNFNPRSPWGERQSLKIETKHARRYFNPRSPWGERPNLMKKGVYWALFQSTLSVRRATCRRKARRRHPLWFQSTLSVRRATVGKCCKESPNNISIHALREESDWMMLVVFLGLSEFQSTLSVRRATVDYINVGLAVDISIHALREESDQHRYWRGQAYGHFNPRSPWGERPHDKKACLSCSFYFNPRSPWGERPLYMYRW